jgi:hypothetical protein
MKIYKIEDLISYNMCGLFGTSDGSVDFIVEEGTAVLNKLILSVINDPHYRRARDPKTNGLLNRAEEEREK